MQTKTEKHEYAYLILQKQAAPFNRPTETMPTSYPCLPRLSRSLPGGDPVRKETHQLHAGHLKKPQPTRGGAL